MWEMNAPIYDALVFEQQNNKSVMGQLTDSCIHCLSKSCPGNCSESLETLRESIEESN